MNTFIIIIYLPTCSQMTIFYIVCFLFPPKINRWTHIASYLLRITRVRACSLIWNDRMCKYFVFLFLQLKSYSDKQKRSETDGGGRTNTVTWRLLIIMDERKQQIKWAKMGRRYMSYAKILPVCDWITVVYYGFFIIINEVSRRRAHFSL